MSAFNEQIQGTHYKGLAIQPVEYIHKNKLGFCEGCVVKYVTRWRDKGGFEDLKKAKHFLDLLMEMEGNGNTRPVEQGKMTDGETVRDMGEWVVVNGPSKVPVDLKAGDEVEHFNGGVYAVKEQDGYGYVSYDDMRGQMMYVGFDEITAYRRKA